MTQEIEKKYLIRENNQEYMTEEIRQIYPSVQVLKDHVLSNGKKIQQGYMSLHHGRALAQRIGVDFEFTPSAIRLREMAGKYFFTIKGDGGLSRREEEFEITRDVFDEFWSFTDGRRVGKVRLSRPYAEYILEIDVYTNNRDLIVAEIEVPTIPEAMNLKPLGLDVTEDDRYSNRNLAK